MVLNCGGGGGGDSKLCAFLKRGRIIPRISEACTDDVEAAYSKFKCLETTREDKVKPACSVFTPPVQ